MSSKATEILRALNSQIAHPGGAPTHPLEAPNEEKPKAEGAVEGSISPSDGIQNQTNNKLQINSFDANLKYEEKQEAPECLTQILGQQLGVIIDETASQHIESLLKQRDKIVYDSMTKGENQYLLALLDQAKKKEGPHFDIISGLISKRSEKIEQDLEEGNLLVNYQRNLTNRKQLEKLEKLDRARMIKIKDGELRSKMDILNEKMDKFKDIQAWDFEDQRKIEEEIQKKLLENMDANNYSLDSEKTKIAKDYVKYMQQQRRQFEKRRKQRQAKSEQQQKERQADLKEAQQMRDLAKRQEILQKVQLRRKKKEEEEKEYQAQQEHVKKVLSEFHRKLPIFKIKQKQFEERILKPQQKYREEKLNQIRQNRRSLSLNQIMKHESSYIGKLSIEKKKRQQQFKLLMKARNAEEKRKQYYKGSAHARIQEMTKQDVLRSYSLREASKIKANRMKEYSEVIYKHHQPTVDQEKKKQLIKCIEDDIMKKKHARKLFKQVVDQTTNQVRFQSYYEEIPQKDVYKEGNRFLEEAKRRIKKKQSGSEKGEESAANSPKDPKIKLLSSSNTENQKKNRSLWQLRAKQLEQMTNADVVDAKNFESVKKNIENMDNKAAQKQQLLRRIDLSIDEHINQKGMLDHYYLQSIKQKMKLLE